MTVGFFGEEFTHPWIYTDAVKDAGFAGFAEEKTFYVFG
jgi:hypothetical protein